MNMPILTYLNGLSMFLTLNKSNTQSEKFIKINLLCYSLLGTLSFKTGLISASALC